MDDYNDLMDQINDLAPQQQGNVTDSSDAGLASSISGFGVDNIEENLQYIEENQHPEAIILGHGLENVNFQGKPSSGCGTSISKSETSEFVPEVIEIKTKYEKQNPTLNGLFSELKGLEPSPFLDSYGFPIPILNFDKPVDLIKSGYSDEVTSLDIAISRNSADELKTLFEIHADPKTLANTKTGLSFSFLHRLIKNPPKKEVNLEMIELFLRYGADVNNIEVSTLTPLDLALNHCYNNINLVKLLLKYGADLSDYCLNISTDENTKQLLNEFETLTDEINNITDNKRKSNLTENEKQLETLKLKKVELLKINQELIPINKRLEWCEKNEREKQQQQRFMDESFRLKTSIGNDKSDNLAQHKEYCGFKNGFLLSKQSNKGERNEKIEKLEGDLQKKRMQTMFCSDQSKIKLFLEISDILKQIENLKIE